jgi:hypothetical protein
MDPYNRLIVKPLYINAADIYTSCYGDDADEDADEHENTESIHEMPPSPQGAPPRCEGCTNWPYRCWNEIQCIYDGPDSPCYSPEGSDMTYDDDDSEMPPLAPAVA